MLSVLAPISQNSSMNETVLSAETDEILDTSTFSLVALIGFLLSLVGIFSLQYIQVLPFAILGGALGALSLLIAKRNRFGFVSKMFGFLAVVIGATTASTGYFGRVLEDKYDLSQSQKICDLYLDSLSKGDMDRVLFLAGIDPIRDPQSELTAAREAVSRIRTDAIHLAIKNRKTPAKWKFLGPAGDFASAGSHNYRLSYQDLALPNPPTYILTTRKTSSKRDRKATSINWYVESLVVADAP
jgi:hypothetical protein